MLFAYEEIKGKEAFGLGELSDDEARKNISFYNYRIGMVRSIRKDIRENLCVDPGDDTICVINELLTNCLWKHALDARIIIAIYDNEIALDSPSMCEHRKKIILRYNDILLERHQAGYDNAAVDQMGMIFYVTGLAHKVIYRKEGRFIVLLRKKRRRSKQPLNIAIVHMANGDVMLHAENK